MNIVKLQTHGFRFEIACYPSKVINFREGVEVRWGCWERVGRGEEGGVRGIEKKLLCVCGEGMGSSGRGACNRLKETRGVVKGAI